MSKRLERDERFARSHQVATTTIDQERSAREAKTLRLRAMRIAQEAEGRPPVVEAKRRKPSVR